MRILLAKIVRKLLCRMLTLCSATWSRFTKFWASVPYLRVVVMEDATKTQVNLTQQSLTSSEERNFDSWCPLKTANGSVTHSGSTSSHQSLMMAKLLKMLMVVKILKNSSKVWIYASSLKSSTSWKKVSCMHALQHWWWRLICKRDNTQATYSRLSRRMQTLRLHWVQTQRDCLVKTPWLKRLFSSMNLQSWDPCWCLW